MSDKCRIAELEAALELWMGEQPSGTFPEDAEYRLLCKVPKAKRTDEQTQRLRELARRVTWLHDEKIQYDRAEKLEAENARLREEKKHWCEVLDKVGASIIGASKRHGHFQSAVSQIRDEASDALNGETEPLRALRYIKTWCDRVFKGRSHVD